MTRLLVPLITLGCFCVLASYAHGRYEPGHKQATARHQAAPVVLSRGTGMASAARTDCGLDWLCLVALAEEQNPAKHRKGHRNG